MNDPQQPHSRRHNQDGLTFEQSIQRSTRHLFGPEDGCPGWRDRLLVRFVAQYSVSTADAAQRCRTASSSQIRSRLREIRACPTGRRCILWLQPTAGTRR